MSLLRSQFCSIFLPETKRTSRLRLTDWVDSCGILGEKIHLEQWIGEHTSCFSSQALGAGADGM